MNYILGHSVDHNKPKPEHNNVVPIDPYIESSDNDGAATIILGDARLVIYNGLVARKNNQFVEISEKDADIFYKVTIHFKNLEIPQALMFNPQDNTIHRFEDKEIEWEQYKVITIDRISIDQETIEIIKGTSKHGNERINK